MILPTVVDRERAEQQGRAVGITKAVNAGAQVINLSLTYTPTQSVVNAINYAASKGVIIVYAGGNSAMALNGGTNSGGFTPAALKRLVFVGSVNSQNVLSSFSNTPGGGSTASTAELCWALLMSCARDLGKAERLMRSGGWHDGIRQMVVLEGKRLGIIGLGRLGSRVAGYGRAFGMDVVAWSENLTEEKAAKGGARLVSKDELLEALWQGRFVSESALTTRINGDVIGAGWMGRVHARP